MSAQHPSAPFHFARLVAGFLTVVCFGPLLVPNGSAHPISLSTVVANVETNKVTVEMKILVEDLMLFQDVQPNDQQTLEAEALRTASEAHEAFLLKYFQIRDVDGVPTSGKVLTTDHEEIPDEGVQQDALMATSVYYQLEYALEVAPNFLTFSQNFGGDANPLPSVMDLIVLQNSARLGYPVQISPQNPHSVELDWENPPTNDRKSWRERRELMKQRREDLLGITSYSTTYSYLYITDQEVRHEILVPVLTLETWVPIERAASDFLEVAEQEASVDVIEAFFQSHSPVVINGSKVTPTIDRVDYYGLDFRDFAQKAPKKRVGIHNARAGIILSYPTTHAPQSLQLTWETFNEHTPLLNTIVYDHHHPGYRHFFTPAEPTFEWTPIEDTAVPSPTADHAAIDLPTPPQEASLQLPMLSVAALLIFTPVLLVSLSTKRYSWAGVSLVVLLTAGMGWNYQPYKIRIPQTVPPDEIITKEDGQRVFAALHTNIYDAFEAIDESEIYDTLAQSVSGQLLESLYLNIRNGLRMEEQGGAIARISDTRIESTELLDRSFHDSVPQFSLRSIWNVAGTVEHWGHIHTRENQYQATFTVQGAPDGWKIIQMAVENEERIAFKTGIRETK